MKKIFCIGLHKTGTTTLHSMAIKAGYKSTHTVNWNDKLNKYDFFCDGGSHYNGQNEFNYQELLNLYPDSIFIINMRDIRSWIISKCKHAKWNSNTVILPDKESYLHNEWEHKSLKNISLFIEHYYDWYIKILTFFLDKKESVIVVDIINKYNIDKLKNMLNPNKTYNLDHKNKSSSAKLSSQVLNYIDQEILLNKDKAEILNNLVKEYQ